MKVNKILNNQSSFPNKLKTISSPPSQLFVMGDIQPLSQKPVVSIVGSRAVTPYGRQVTQKLAGELASRGVAIVSGLALGVDAIAHHAALQAGGYTVAVLPSPVDEVYPATNRSVAQEILTKGGALISEYAESGRPEAFKSNFIARNRLVSGLADILLITEASDRSGTLHTANFALDQGKTVMVVPGNITSPNSKGTNSLIKAGASVVTSVQDVLNELNLGEAEASAAVMGANKDENAILDLLKAGITDSASLLKQSELSADNFNQSLTMLELSGKIRPLGAGHWSIN